MRETSTRTMRTFDRSFSHSTWGVKGLHEPHQGEKFALSCDFDSFKDGREHVRDQSAPGLAPMMVPLP